MDGNTLRTETAYFWYVLIASKKLSFSSDNSSCFLENNKESKNENVSKRFSKAYSIHNQVIIKKKSYFCTSVIFSAISGAIFLQDSKKTQKPFRNLIGNYLLSGWFVKTLNHWASK